MLERIKDWLLGWLQRDCPHSAGMVAADILEGEGEKVIVQYCNRCGAARFIYYCEDRLDVLRLPNPKDLARGVRALCP